MNRVVICLEELMDNDGETTKVLVRIEEPWDVTDSDKIGELHCSPTQPPFSELADAGAGPIAGNLVKQAGQRVYESLCGHAGIKDAINRAVLSDGNGVQPIIIQTTAVGAESLPWESLFHPQRQFLALNQRWPIARLAGRRIHDVKQQPLRLPLKITAILAAKDRDAMPEWHALRQAVVAADLPCKLHVFVAQTEVKDAILADDQVNASAAMVPTDKDSLVSEILAQAPDVLHVFCHGTAGSSSYLEIANRNTMELNDEPLYVAARDLARLQESVWLVVMNACQGAAPVTEAHSLAYSLVRDGIPAAIGMREAIDSADAHVFCGALFGELLRMVDHGLQNGGKVEMAWGQLMCAPRDKLCEHRGGPPTEAAAAHKEWTLPVLYHRHGTFVLEKIAAVAAADESLQEQQAAALDTLKLIRSQIHPETPPQDIAEVDRHIRELSEQLYGLGG